MFEERLSEPWTLSVFLSGPMTGIEHYNAEAFAAAHAKLRESGVVRVYDPVQEWMGTDGNGDSHEVWMRVSIRALVTREIHVLATVDGWERSEGAKTEVEVARACGIPVMSVDELCGLIEDAS